MDTVVVVVRESQMEQVRAYLTSTFPSQSNPWLVSVAGKPAIFINIVPAHEADLEPEDMDELRQRLKSEDLVAVLADVAVRPVGCAELRSLVVALLEQFNGLASDDVADHWWTAGEIKSPSLAGYAAFWSHDIHVHRPEGDA